MNIEEYVISRWEFISRTIFLILLFKWLFNYYFHGMFILLFIYYYLKTKIIIILVFLLTLQFIERTSFHESIESFNLNEIPKEKLYLDAVIFLTCTMSISSQWVPLCKVISNKLFAHSEKIYRIFEYETSFELYLD